MHLTWLLAPPPCKTQLRVTAFGQSYLVGTKPMGRGPSLGGAGCWHLSPADLWGVVSPCTVSPLQLRPQYRCVEPVQKPQVAPAWTRRPLGGPGVPSQVDGLKHWLGPKGVLFEVKLG